MTRRSRIWTGATLLIIILLNYAIIGIPLIKKSASLQEKYKTVLIKQVKSGEMFKNSGDEYLLEIFRKEKVSIDRKIIMLNCIALSLAFIIVSWTIFGILKTR